MEKLIEDLEAKIEALNQKFLDPAAYSQELMDEYEVLKKELDQAMKDWEDSEQELELLSS